jgi:hypothetical protein
MEVAKRTINLADVVLNRADVENIPTDVLKRFLSKQPIADVPVPDWAKDLIPESQRAQADAAAKAKAEGQKFWEARPPHSVSDEVDFRLPILEKVLNKFGSEPQVATRLLDLGAADKISLGYIMDKLNNPVFGQVYEKTLRNSLPYAQDIEAIRYMFQFADYKYLPGAREAAGHAQPDLEQFIQGAVKEQGPAIQNARIAASEPPLEEQDLHEAVIQQLVDEDKLDTPTKQWEAIQRALYDLVTGNLPPKGGAGRGGNRPPRRS